MEIKLEDLDQVRERTGVSYAEAKMALEEADGNVLDAIVALEETNAKTTEKNSEVAKEIVEKIKKAFKEGNVTKIQMKREGKIILSIQSMSESLVGLWVLHLHHGQLFQQCWQLMALIANFHLFETMDQLKI